MTIYGWGVSLFSGVIQNCYDSHVHWLGTGLIQSQLSLKGLRQIGEGLKPLVSESNFSGDWLLGFGWDENLWSPGKVPNRKVLDQIFPEFPVAFSRGDGHAIWLNSRALNIIMDSGRNEKYNDFKIEALPLSFKNLRNQIGLSADESLSGVFLDEAKLQIEKNIPPPNPNQKRLALLRGQDLFLSEGFSHIRDLTCTKEQFEISLELESEKTLQLYVEEFFGAFSKEDFQTALESALWARSEKSQRLRVQGVKVFYDGALGSQGALLSQCYCNSQRKGFQLIEEVELSEMITETWSNDLEIAVHVIGDEACDQVSKVAARLWEKGLSGRLHLEHVEVLRAETIDRLKGHSVTCHMQPCHWHTDKKWLKGQLKGLFSRAFPWADLEEAKIPVFFGSDSPIEKPSIQLNLSALKDCAQEGIRQPLGGIQNYHSHPDKNWPKNLFSEFEMGQFKGLTRDDPFEG